MKTYIILVSLVIAVSAAEWKLKTKQERNAIIAECDRRIPDPLPDQVQVGPNIEKIPMPKFLCMLRGLGIWSDSDGFIEDRIMTAFDKYNKEKLVDREKFRNNLAGCQDKNTQKSSIDEWAYRTFNCFRGNRELWKDLRHVNAYTSD